MVRSSNADVSSRSATSSAAARRRPCSCPTSAVPTRDVEADEGAHQRVEALVRRDVAEAGHGHLGRHETRQQSSHRLLVAMGLGDRVVARLRLDRPGHPGDGLGPVATSWTRSSRDWRASRLSSSSRAPRPARARSGPGDHEAIERADDAGDRADRGAEQACEGSVHPISLPRARACAGADAPGVTRRCAGGGPPRSRRCSAGPRSPGRGTPRGCARRHTCSCCAARRRSGR